MSEESKELKDLMSIEDLHLKRLADLVQESIDEEQLLTTRLLELDQDSELTWGQVLADKVAEFGGSWTFIVAFFTILAVWIVLNVVFLREKSFDPYPFILLNLVLSCIAAIQAPIIMMSQNRQEDKDRRRARSDYLINMKAEMEVRSLHGKIDLLLTEQMKSLFKVQQMQMDLLKKIESSLNSSARS